MEISHGTLFNSYFSALIPMDAKPAPTINERSMNTNGPDDTRDEYRPAFYIFA